MPKSSSSVFLSSGSLEQLRSDAETLFQQIIDRLDEIEGIRGTFENESTSVFDDDLTAQECAYLVKDENGTIIHAMGNY